MFHLKKILCFVIFLFSAIHTNTAFSGVRNVKLPVKINGFLNFSSDYIGNIAKDQNEAFSNFLDDYNDCKKNNKFIYNELGSLTFKTNHLVRDLVRDSNVEHYYNAIIKQFEKFGIVGAHHEFSICLSKLLTDVGLENHVIYIEENDIKNISKNSHTANLFKINEEWFVADATLDIQIGNFDNYLKIPLEKYESEIKNIFNFSKPLIKVIARDVEDKLYDASYILLDRFLTINQYFFQNPDYKKFSSNLYFRL